MLEKLKHKLKSIKEKLSAKIRETTEQEEAEPVAPPEHPKLLRVKRTVKGVFRRKISESDLDDVLWDLHVSLLESDTALPVAQEIIQYVKSELVGKELELGKDPRKLAESLLRESIRRVLMKGGHIDLFRLIEQKRGEDKPAVIVFFGVNGVGKTTTIAKVAKMLMDRGYRVLLAAADTFRAAGIEQLEIHASKLGIPVVKQRRGADAAAVAFDAVAHARARHYDVVLVDTAGRMQTDVDLMDEMKKIVRVIKPDLKIFVGDALTGNDAVEQAQTFDREIGIDAVILCKMDADARGGAALSISYVTGKPILALGTGQRYEDLVQFNPDLILNAIFAD